MAAYNVGEDLSCGWMASVNQSPTVYINIRTVAQIVAQYTLQILTEFFYKTDGLRLPGSMDLRRSPNIAQISGSELMARLVSPWPSTVANNTDRVDNRAPYLMYIIAVDTSAAQYILVSNRTLALLRGTAAAV